MGYLEKSVNDRYADTRGEALYKLGEIYYKGELVKKDEQKANSYWRDAAEEGYDDAIDCLRIYFGETVDND